MVEIENGNTVKSGDGVLALLPAEIGEVVEAVSKVGASSVDGMGDGIKYDYPNQN